MVAALDLAIRSCIVLALAWAMTALLRRQPASLRALVWTIGFGGLLVLPILSRAMPALHVPVWQESIRIEEAPAAVGVTAPRSENAPRAVSIERAPATASVVTPLNPIDTPPQSVEAFSVDWSLMAMAASAFISLLLLIRIAASHVRLARLIADAGTASVSWVALVDELRPVRRIRRAVGVRITDAVNVPAIVGVFRPTLILPADADAWDADLRRAVVLHELAHVARWDALAQLTGQIACAFYWFNPLAWHGARRAAALRERASDDEVIRAGVPAPAYAARLLTLVREAGIADRHLATLAMARPSRMRERVMAILDPVARREGLTMRNVAAVMILSSCAVAAIAAAAPEPTESLILTRAAMSVPQPLRGMAAPAPTAATAVLPAAAPAAIPAAAIATAGEAAIAPQNIGLCDGGADHTHIQGSENGRRTLTIKLSGSDCKVELKSEGRLTFNDSFTDIASIDGSGFFRLDVTQRGVRRQLEIDSRGGSLSRIWRVDGRETAYDDAARAWFAEFLIALDRRTAIGIDVRLPHLMRTGGVNAVLDETARMTGDYARHEYYTRLVKTASLSSADVTRVLQQAANATKSDHYANELIHAVAGRGVSDPAQRAAVTQIIDGMESDHYRAASIEVLVAGGRPDAQEMDFLIRTLPKMESDHYKTQTLTKVLKGATLTDAQVSVLAKAAAGITSDHYASEFLRTIARHGTMTPAVRASVLESVKQIEGDHYRTETLSTLLEASTVSEQELLTIVATASSMGDHYQAEALRKVVRHRNATARVKDAAIAAADQLSRHYRDEVRRSAGR